jgi:5'-3' exonuclease
MKWIGFQKNVDESPENVINIFKNHLESQLVKLAKKHKGHKFIFCQDEKQSKVWRNLLYSDYKSTRGEADEMIGVLKDVVMGVAKDYGIALGYDGLEADDIAFLTVKYIRKCNENCSIVIITSDRDYLQMVFDDHIKIINGSGKLIEGLGDSKKDLMMKILMGDKSDNIPPVCKGCGKKTAEELALNPEKLTEFIEKNGCQAEYDRNTRLICMDQIPDDLVEGFQKKCVPILATFMNSI